MEKTLLTLINNTITANTNSIQILRNYNIRSAVLYVRTNKEDSDFIRRTKMMMRNSMYGM